MQKKDKYNITVNLKARPLKKNLKVTANSEWNSQKSRKTSLISMQKKKDVLGVLGCKLQAFLQTLTEGCWNFNCHPKASWQNDDKQLQHSNLSCEAVVAK